MVEIFIVVVCGIITYHYTSQLNIHLISKMPETTESRIFCINAVIVTFAASQQGSTFVLRRALFLQVSVLFFADFIREKQMQHNWTNLRKIFTLGESEQDSSSNVGVFTKLVPPT